MAEVVGVGGWFRRVVVVVVVFGGCAFGVPVVSASASGSAGASGWVDPGVPVSEDPAAVDGLAGVGGVVDGFGGPSVSFPGGPSVLAGGLARVREVVEARTAVSERWLNSDGSFTEVVFTEPRYFRSSGSGVFVPIDGRVVADPSWSGWFRNAGNSWSVWFGPLVTSVGGAWGGVVSSVGGVGLMSSPRSSLIGRIDPEVDGEAGVVTYRGVWPNVDVRYSVRPEGVKEDLVVTGPIDQSEFVFDVAGPGLAGLDPTGGVVLAGGIDASIAAPSVQGVDGHDVTGEARPSFVVDGEMGSSQLLRLQVDRSWMVSQGVDAFPLVIDPTLVIGSSSWASYGSTPGFFCGTTCGHRVGNSMAGGGDMVWRSVAYFPYETLIDTGKQVISAALNVARNTSVAGTSASNDFYACWASDWSYSGSCANGYSGTSVVGDAGSIDLTDLYRKWVGDGTRGGTLGLAINAVSGAYSLKELSANVSIVWNTPPPSPVNDVSTSPASGAVVSSLTPTLTVGPVTDADGDGVLYGFSIASGEDGLSGSIVASGALLPATPVSWVVPDGALRDGQTYYWRVYSWDMKYLTMSTWTRSFKVDLRLGSGGPSPTDQVGPVLVNLATGNASLSVSTPSVSTTSGDLASSLVYNSAQAANTGLRARYYNDWPSNRLFDDALVLTRNDPQINFDWALGGPGKPIGSDNFLVQWDGYINPGVGTFNLGVRSDDGVRVVLDGTNTVINDWTDHGVLVTPNWSNALSFTGSPRRIHIEYYESTGAAFLQLWLKSSTAPATGGAILQSKYLSTDASPVPSGWVFGSAGAAYVSAEIHERSVDLHASDGTTWNFTMGTGATPGWVAPEGLGVVMVTNLDGSIGVHAADGATYLFNTSGNLLSVTSSRDDRHPAAVQRTWQPLANPTDPERLVAVSDSVSNTEVTFTYFGQNNANCPVLYGSPVGMLCRITGPDGSTTDLGYDTAGRLVRVTKPGASITTFGYDASGRMISIVDPIANDAISAGQRTIADSTTTITYTNGRVASVTLPAPTAGAARSARTYANIAGTTTITTAGIGQTSSVTYDANSRRTSSTDATGRTSYTTWDTADRPTSSIDSAGIENTRVYDAHGWLTDVYGPAAQSSFTGLIGGAGVTHSTIAYDQSINGLAAAWFSNGNLAGSPILHTTGVGSADGQIWADWITPPNGLPAGNFGVRLTGEISLPASGTYVLSLFSKSRVRLYLDDNLMIDGWSDPGSTATVSSASVSNTAANATHRIRIDVGEINQQASLGFAWTAPGSTLAVVPGSNLEPLYGLPTTTTKNVGTSAEVTTHAYRDTNGIGPEHGLVTSTTTDPTGLNLTTTTSYENPNNGGHLRAVSTTPPAGSTATTTVTYYGDAETRANPCATNSNPINQGGRPRFQTAADPDGNGTQQPIVHENVYDVNGRVVASRTDTEPWNCTTYDTRGRPVTATHPAFGTTASRTVTYNYSVQNNPLKYSVSDPTGTITTTIDLLGRTITTTDITNTATTTTYDQAGRPTTTTTTTTTGTLPALGATYDAAGRTETVTLGGALLADPAYDTAGRLASVSYPTGTGKAGNATSGAFTYDTKGRPAKVTWTGPTGLLSSDQITARDGLGRITDFKTDTIDPYTTGVNFMYDRAGRLTTARTSGHISTYSYGSSTCAAPALATTGKNTNRTQVTDNGVTVTNCYDSADRLISSTDPAVGAITYDTHGNTTAIFGETHTYDATDRHMGTAGGATTVAYTRDALDRITERKVNGTTIARYVYASSADTPVATLDATGNLLERTIALPGGVTITVRSTGNVWSYPNLHGDIAATATQTGVKNGTTARFDPNGNQTSGSVADNSTGNFDNRWLGQYQRPTETEPGLEPIIEMGARQYSPRLGRFLETDPVTGGSANAYAYTFGDPTNTNDITGKCPECGLLALIAAYYAIRSQDPLDNVRPLDHTIEILAIFPHPPEEPRHEPVTVEDVVNTIVGAAKWVTKHPVQAAYYAAACYSMATLMGLAGGAWGFGLAGPLGAAIGWPAGYVSGCIGGIAAAENGGIVGP